MNKYRFVLTTTKGSENLARSEIFILLTELGDKSAKIVKTNNSGVLVVETILSPEEILPFFMKIIELEPWKIRSVLRVVPVDGPVETDLEKIVEAVEPMLTRISENESFRITIEKRNSNLQRNDIINSIASKISRKVDLINPDWIVQIEIIGAETYVSVVHPNQILSITKAKRDKISI
jgi:tRNA acetyltransferase TAN1